MFFSNVFVFLLCFSRGIVAQIMNRIISEIRKGNQKIFKEFFTENYENLVVYANSYLFDNQASQDVVQDVFIHLWEKAEDIKIETSLLSYVRAMVRNRCLNYLKSIKIIDNFGLLKTNIHLITEHVFETAEEDDKKIIYHQIIKIIDTLPERMQQVVKLKLSGNYTYKEIAEELGISVNTVKTQLRRARGKITGLITGVLILLKLL